jgi:hypothetical protein
MVRKRLLNLKAIRKNERKEKQETIAITDHAVG